MWPWTRFTFIDHGNSLLWITAGFRNRSRINHLFVIHECLLRRGSGWWKFEHKYMAKWKLCTSLYFLARINIVVAIQMIKIWLYNSLANDIAIMHFSYYCTILFFITHLFLLRFFFFQCNFIWYHFSSLWLSNVLLGNNR